MINFTTGIKNINEALYELLYEHKESNLLGLCRRWGARYALTEVLACRNAWHY